MSIHTIRMPDIGEGIAEVEIVEWRVAAGDRVAEDQTLCDVMTDKAAVEVPSSVTAVCHRASAACSSVRCQRRSAASMSLRPRQASQAGRPRSAQGKKVVASGQRPITSRARSWVSLR